MKNIFITQMISFELSQSVDLFTEDYVTMAILLAFFNWYSNTFIIFSRDEHKKNCEFCHKS